MGSEMCIRDSYWVPESKPVDDLLREMQARRQHLAIVVDEYDAEEVEVETLDDGVVRVSSRYPIDDLDELFGFDVEEEDVDSVGGLMAKHLGLVPIPGSQVVAHGLRFTAEDTTGRRNKIGTVRIARVHVEPTPASDDTAAKEAVRD